MLKLTNEVFVSADITQRVKGSTQRLLNFTTDQKKLAGDA